MKKQKALIYVIVLLLITGIAAFSHLSTREEVPKHGIQISWKEEEIILDIEKLEYENVTGSYVTGKGETRDVDAPGILLDSLLEKVGIDQYEKAIITADDSYSVEVLKEEAYFIKEEDSLRLIVFGDKDSKRNVKNVVKIEVE